MRTHILMAILLCWSLWAPQNAHAVVNVMDFGAKGTGVDDTAAIRRAVEYARQKADFQVLFPPGNFIISGTIVLEDVTLLGATNTEVSEFSDSPESAKSDPRGHFPLSTRLSVLRKDITAVQLLGNASLKNIAIWYPNFIKPDRLPAYEDFPSYKAIAIRLGGPSPLTGAYRTWNNGTLQNLDIRYAYRGISTDPAYSPKNPSPLDIDYSGNTLDHVQIARAVDWAVYLNWKNAALLQMTNLIVSGEPRADGSQTEILVNGVRTMRTMPISKGAFLDNVLNFSISDSEVSTVNGPALGIYNSAARGTQNVLRSFRMETNFLRTESSSMILTQGFRNLIDGVEMLTAIVKLDGPRNQAYFVNFVPVLEGSTMTVNQVAASLPQSRFIKSGRFYKIRQTGTKGITTIFDPSILRHDVSAIPGYVVFAKDKALHRLSAAPRAGTWVQGDVIRNSSGSGGWKCSTSGTFGSIIGTATITSGKLKFTDPIPRFEIGDYVSIKGFPGRWLVTGVMLFDKSRVAINGVVNSPDLDDRGTVTVVNVDPAITLPASSVTSYAVQHVPPVF